MTNTKTNSVAKTCPVNSWASDARMAEYNFLKTVQFALEQFETKNNLPLYKLVGFVEGRKIEKIATVEGYRLKQFATPLKNVMAKTLSNVKITFKNGKGNAKVGENGGINKDMLEALRVLAAQKLGPNSKEFKKTFGPEKKPTPEFDCKVWASKEADKAPELLAVKVAALQVQLKAYEGAKIGTGK